MFKKLLFSLVLVLYFFQGSVLAEVLGEDCYSITTNKKVSSFLCYKYEKTADKILTTVSKIQPDGYFDSPSVKILFTETLDFKPVSILVTDNSSQQPRIYEAKVNADKVVINSLSNPGVEPKIIFLENTGIIFPYKIKTLLNDIAKNPNLSYTTIEYRDDFKEVVLVKKFVKDDVIDNQKVKKYSVKYDITPNLEILEFYNLQGIMLQKNIKMFDISQKLVDKGILSYRLSNKNIASKAVFPLHSDVESIKNAKQVSYKIEDSQGILSSYFINDERQRVLQIYNNSVYLKNSLDYNSVKEDNKNLKKYLDTTILINPLNSNIKKIAAEYSKKYTNKEKLAVELKNYVSKNFTNNINMTENRSIDTIFASKKANPIEQAIILSSLYRAAGIPAEVVLGEVITDFPSDSFIYHAWVKYYVNGWHCIDSFYNKAEITPDYIAIYQTSFNKKNDITFMTEQAPLQLKEIKISVLNFILKNDLKENPEFIEQSEQKEISKLNFLENDDIIGDSRIQNINRYKVTKQDLIRNAVYNYNNNNIEKAVEEFKQASKLLSNNNEFIDILYSKKLAAIGVFDISKSILTNIYDKQQWKKQVNSIERIYYPKIMPTNSNLTDYIKAYNLIKNKKQYDEAISVLESHLSSSSDYACYLFAMGYEGKQDYTKAKSYIKKALSVNENNLSYKFLYARILYENQQYKQALNIIKSIKSEFLYDKEFATELDTLEYQILADSAKDKKGKDYYTVKYLISNNKISDADKILADYSDSPEFLILKSGILIEKGEFKKAQEILSAVIKNSPSSEAYELLADTYTKEENYTNAVNYYEKALKVSSDKSKIYTKTGVAHYYAGNYALAETCFKKAIKADENNYLAYTNLGRVYSDNDNLQLANQNYKDSLAINPLVAKTWAYLSENEIKRKNYFLATEYLTPIKLINPNSPDYYYIYGLIELGYGNKSKALSILEYAYSLNPNSVEIKRAINKVKN
ncbi:MAG: tetratricopeptide repeat protein [Candidatus Gastranaerophilales bacterium]|nr:tetratricopeptide repeat protein [Candidatus Gastranaerophilales bacterium]